MLLKRSLIVFFLMILTAISAYYIKSELTPTTHFPKLDKLLPVALNGWHKDTGYKYEIVDPVTQREMDKIYSQTVSAIYHGPNGEMMMVSIAYGADQRDEFQVHKPEVCYPAQGYEVLNNQANQLKTAFGPISIRQLETKSDLRQEYVTYWIRVGDRVPANNLERKWVQLKMAMEGQIPDGLLFRVSSIGAKAPYEFDQQAKFIKELLAKLPDREREILIGQKG